MEQYNYQGGSPYSNKNSSRGPLIALISVLCVFIVAAVGFLAYYIISEKSQDSNASFQPPILNITACPQQVSSDNPYATVEGVMMSDSPSCILNINGETISVSNTPGVQTKWSKTFQLTAGETKTLVIEARDGNNLITSETKTIYCQELQEKNEKQLAPITPGCTLVKKKANGLNIREYPGTEYDIVAYIERNDYTSEMIFTGNYRVNHENYTWYEVIAPNGKHGYVRSDLVRTNTYVD